MRGLYRVKNLTKIYEKKEVFKNLDLEIKNDEITVILGKSGCGKTTLMRILSKLDEAVIIDGKEYGLYTNIGKNYISKGYKYQELFKKEYIPIFTYKVKDVL